MHLKEGTEFAKKYTLVKLLGTGGFSEVWLAERSNGFKQALKIYTGLDEAGIEVFRAEFERVYNLNHARILKPSDFGVFQNRPYLIMPYCKNGSALSMIGSANEKTLAKVIVDIGSALDYLHTRPDFVIHQDIKPDNILIDDSGNFLLTDFGISTRFRATLKKSINKIERKTEKHDNKHTSGITPPSYRAPEMYTKDRNTREPIMATDMWAFGATLYELATGEVPYGEYGGLLQQQGVERPDLPSSFSPGLANILARCMAKETWDRPTAGELVKLAEGFLKNQSWGVMPLAVSAPAPAPAPLLKIKPVKKSSSKKLLFPLIAAAVLLIGGGGWWLQNQAATKAKANELFTSANQKMEARSFYSARNDYKAIQVLGTGIYPDLNDRIQASTDSITANVSVHIDAAAGFIKEEKYAEAGVSLRKAQAFDPDNESVKTTLSEIEIELDKLYEKEMTEAKNDLDKKKFEKAAEHAGLALNIRPNDSEADELRKKIQTDSIEHFYAYHIAQAKEMQKKKNYDDAIAHVDDALSLKDEPAARQMRVDILKERDEAFANFVRSADRANNLGECATAKGLYQQALYVKSDASEVRSKMEALKCIKTARLTSRPRNSYDCLKFTSAEVNETQTLIKMSFPASCGGGNVSLYPPGNPNAYILTVGGRKYPLRRISGITPGTGLKFTTDRNVSLYFDRLPEGTSQFSLKEGSRQIDPGSTYWNFDNIKIAWK